MHGTFPQECNVDCLLSPIFDNNRSVGFKATKITFSLYLTLDSKCRLNTKFGYFLVDCLSFLSQSTLNRYCDSKIAEKYLK